MKKFLTSIVAILVLTIYCAPDASAQKIQTKKDKKIEALTHQLDSLQQAYDALYEDYHSLLEPVNSEGDDMISDDELAPDHEYTVDEIDSLLSVYYIQKTMDGSEFSFESVEGDSLVSHVPDSIYVQRLKKMNSFIPVEFNKYVKNSIILYTEKLKTTPKILGLATYYVPIIEEILDEYDLPKELKAMAVIESAFNPKAISRARAKGMWQFMYSTAKRYGLYMNSFVEERYDPIKSCRAAAQYLKDSYMIFGDWSLAIASYNCGAGNVSKAIRRSGGKRDFWSVYPYLPRETRGYFPAFIAALYTLQYYGEHNITPAPITLPAHVDTFHVGKMLHFQQISDVIGIPMEQLRDVNPQYVHDIIPGVEREYILNIPHNYTNAFAEHEAEIYAYKDSVFFSTVAIKKIKETGGSDGQRIVHKVKSGETLGGIARRYRTSVTNIKNWNGLRSNTIRVGQKLYIYGSAGSGSSSSKSAAQVVKESNTQSSGGYEIYIVKKGDTLGKIASAHGVSLSKIYSLNNLNSKSKIYPGMKIRIKKTE